MDHNKFQINEFDLNSMVPNPSILIIGKKGSGKSYLVRNLLNHFHNEQHIPGGVVISPSELMSSFYKDFFPDLYIHHNLDDTILKKILARQSIMIDRSNKAKSNGLELDPRAVLIMDDCLSQKKSWASNVNIQEIVMNGRHHHLQYIVTMQTPLGITPDMRLNFDYIFLLQNDLPCNRKILWDNYGGMFPTLASFEKVFSTCTENYSTMVIDNRKPSDNIYDKAFWFKASEHNFIFGSDEFNKMHTYYYDSNWINKYRCLNILAPNNNPIAKRSAYSNLFDEPSGYMFEYFINGDKLKEKFRKKWENKMEKKLENHHKPILHSSDDDDISDNEYSDYNHSEIITDYNFNPVKLTNSHSTPINTPTDAAAIIQFTFDDGEYQLAARLNGSVNYKLVKLLCKHVENLKHNK